MVTAITHTGSHWDVTPSSEQERGHPKTDRETGSLDTGMGMFSRPDLQPSGQFSPPKALSQFASKTENDEIKVYLVDDHVVLLECLSAYLSTDSRLRVVGTSSSTEDAANKILAAQPNVIVLDVELPGRSAFDLAETLQMRLPGLKFIFLTGFQSDALISRALKMGCHGYLLKGESIHNVRNAIIRANRGDVTFSAEIQNRLVQDPHSSSYRLPVDSTLAGLTGRQLEVLRHLATGASVKEIAKMMHLSQKSVDSHKYRIMHKLGIHDRVELARFAIREGLTRP